MHEKRGDIQPGRTPNPQQPARDEAVSGHKDAADPRDVFDRDILKQAADVSAATRATRP